jgi:hypothetical protein
VFSRLAHMRDSMDDVAPLPRNMHGDPRSTSRRRSQTTGPGLDDPVPTCLAAVTRLSDSRVWLSMWAARTRAGCSGATTAGAIVGGPSGLRGSTSRRSPRCPVSAGSRFWVGTEPSRCVSRSAERRQKTVGSRPSTTWETLPFVTRVCHSRRKPETHHALAGSPAIRPTPNRLWVAIA